MSPKRFPSQSYTTQNKILLLVVVFIWGFLLFSFWSKGSTPTLGTEIEECEGGVEVIEDWQIEQIPRIIVGIESSAAKKYASNRQAMRETWLRMLDKRVSEKIKYFFFVGNPNTIEDEQLIRQEQQTYGDVVLLDVKDDYTSLTEKSLASFVYSLGLDLPSTRGISDSVATSDFEFDLFLKVNDDTFVRIDRLVPYLANISFNNQDPPVYMGRFHKDAQVFWSAGDKNNELHYPKSMTFLVPFAAGPFYILHLDIIKSLSQLKDRLIRYSNEDVAVGAWTFGMNLTRIDDRRFSSRDCIESAISVHPAPPNMMHLLYDNSMDNKCLCDNYSRSS